MLHIEVISVEKKDNQILSAKAKIYVGWRNEFDPNTGSSVWTNEPIETSATLEEPTVSFFHEGRERSINLIKYAAKI